jgi:hypothetical protein
MTWFSARLLPGFGAALVFSASTARAALDFNTYRIKKETLRIEEGGGTRDSTRISYELTRLGSTSLEASSLTLTSHGGYLNVVEEATLTGNVENRPRDITHDFLFQGSLPIPPLAAVHSLEAWHGDTLFQARLRKAVYSLNDVFFDTAALQATLESRVAFLQQLTDRAFEATFTRLALGEPLRVRIAYHLPFPGKPGAAVRVPVLFHPSGPSPRQVQITFFEKAEGIPQVHWLSPSGRVPLPSSGTHTVAYQSAFEFRRDEAASTVATLQATAFESGSWKGNYLLFKGGLGDSLMDRLSRPLEVVFLWRWNPPFRFVEMRDGLKTLSLLGRTVVQEARAMREIIEEFSPRGHRFGLLHSVEGLADVQFDPAGDGSVGLEDLLAYLDRYTEQSVYAEYKDYKDDRLAWAATAWTDSGAIIRSREAFLDALRTIRKGFGDDAGTLRHIALIGVGDAPSSEIDLKDPEVVEAILDSVTFANINADWAGVDMGSIAGTKANADLRPLRVESPLAAGLPPLLFPVFQPSSVEYRAFTPSRSHAVVLPFSLSAERQAMIKAERPFDDTLQLQGIDALGRKTRILSLRPRVLRASNDSGMARLWAADPDRISESGEVELGMRYGILTKGTYWGANASDGISAATDPENPVSISPLPKSVRVSSSGGFRVQGGMLRIGHSGFRGAEASKARLEVYDLRGRLLLALPLAAFRTGDGFAIPLDVLRRLGQHRVFLVLRGAAGMPPFALNLGGRP